MVKSIIVWLALTSVAHAALTMEQYVKVTTSMVANKYAWQVSGPKGAFTPAPLTADQRTVGWQYTPGEAYTVSVYGATLQGELLYETMVIAPTPPGPTPPGPTPPGPTPGPGPAPTPDPAPVPGKISVLILYESGDVGDPAYKGYNTLLNSLQLIRWLNTHTSKDANGSAEWRVLDKDAPMDFMTEKWKKARAEVLAKFPATAKPYLPVLAVSNGATGVIVQLPKTEVEALALLKKWGGE